MILENIKKQFEKLYLKDKNYSDDTKIHRSTKAKIPYMGKLI